jgi:hypothetical protein
VGLNSLKSLNLTNVYPNNNKNNKVKSKPLELFELAGKKHCVLESYWSPVTSKVERSGENLTRWWKNWGFLNSFSYKIALKTSKIPWGTPYSWATTHFFLGVRVYFVKNPQYRNIPVLRSKKPVLYRFRYWDFNTELETLMYSLRGENFISPRYFPRSPRLWYLTFFPISPQQKWCYGRWPGLVLELPKSLAVTRIFFSWSTIKITTIVLL